MADSDELKALTAQVEQLTRKVGLLEDTHAVRTLHFKYGYYLDMCLYDQVVDLFADSCELHFLNGIYRGKSGVRRLYCQRLRNMWTKGHNGPIHGLLVDHLLLQDIVDVAPDGLTAKGRFRSFMQAGFHDSAETPHAEVPQSWEHGIYENEYVKEGGVWKFRLFDYNMLWQADYAKGWSHSGVHLRPMTTTFPDDPVGPDELTDVVPVAWPHTRVVPFHYPHPVTGEVWRGTES